MSPNPAPESLYITQITALYHPAHYGDQTTNSRLSSLLVPEVAMSEKRKKRLFSIRRLNFTETLKVQEVAYLLHSWLQLQMSEM